MYRVRWFRLKFHAGCAGGAAVNPSHLWVSTDSLYPGRPATRKTPPLRQRTLHCMLLEKHTHSRHKV